MSPGSESNRGSCYWRARIVGMRNRTRYALGVTRSGREKQYPKASEAKARADAEWYLDRLGSQGYESVRIITTREEVETIWAQ